jgi:hypothetical protein
VLHGHPQAFSSDPVERRGGNVSLPAFLDMEIAQEADALDERENISGGWRLWRLHEPRHRTYGGIGFWLQECVERRELRFGQAFRKRAIGDHLGPHQGLPHQHFEDTRNRQQNTLSSHLFEQHLDQPLEFADGLGDRDQPSNVTPRCGPVERLIAKPRHQLGELLPPRLIASAVRLKRSDVDLQLICDEGKKFSRRQFVSSQYPARMPEIAEQHREPEAAMITALGRN